MNPEKFQRHGPNDGLTPRGQAEPARNDVRGVTLRERKGAGELLDGGTLDGDAYGRGGMRSGARGLGGMVFREQALWECLDTPVLRATKKAVFVCA